MTKEIVVNSSFMEERIGILEDSHLTEIFIEWKKHSSILGNIYKGKVNAVLPGMQSAFVDIGIGKDAFLYVKDVFEDTEEYEQIWGEDWGGERNSIAKSHSLAIDELLREGQELLAQVSKESIGNKGARITSYISLPGKYLVFMPTLDHLGISRRIKSEEERKKLREILAKLRKPHAGYIVRTAGEGKGKREFRSDIRYLSSLWKEIKRRGEKTRAPSLIHRDLDLLLRIMRDLFSEEFATVWVDSEEDYRRCLQFVKRLQPRLVDRIKLYTRQKPIFEAFGIEDEIEKALQNKVWLKSGGYIVINRTEALVAIDVNTGRYVGKRDLEETVLKTNLEAVKEIVVQLRLRDLGGIIVIDFIDMEKKANQKKVLDALKKELKKDRSQTDILAMSEFGLVELTRKRQKQSLEETLCQPCPYCQGLGRIKSLPTICHEIYREISKTSLHLRGKELTIRVNPEVASALLGEEYHLVQQLQKELKLRVSVKGDPNLHYQQFDFLCL